MTVSLCPISPETVSDLPSDVVKGRVNLKSQPKPHDVPNRVNRLSMLNPAPIPTGLFEIRGPLSYLSLMTLTKL